MSVLGSYFSSQTPFLYPIIIHEQNIIEMTPRESTLIVSINDDNQQDSCLIPLFPSLIDIFFFNIYPYIVQMDSTNKNPRFLTLALTKYRTNNVSVALSRPMF